MDVFVYGTLTDPARTEAVLADWEYVGGAVLDGLHRVDGGAYPTLAPGGRVEGRLLRSPEVDRLDRHEGVDRGLYVRVSVPRSDGGEVAVYVGDPDRLGAPADWPGEGSFEARVRALVEESEVVVRPGHDRQD